MHHRSDHNKGLIIIKSSEIVASKNIITPMNVTIKQKNNQFTCQWCQTEFNDTPALRSHQYECEADKSLKCDMCPKSYRSMSGLYFHKKQDHSLDTRFECPECPETFPLRFKLLEHTRVHSGVRPYKCNMCSLAFSASHLLRNHKRQHASEKKYGCPICAKKFTYPYMVRAHLRTHTGERPFQCGFCPRTFTLLGDCNKHLKIAHAGAILNNL